VFIFKLTDEPLRVKTEFFKKETWAEKRKEIHFFIMNREFEGQNFCQMFEFPQEQLS